MMGKQALLPVRFRHGYKIPEWLGKVPDAAFPPGPKGFYCYLIIFGKTGCWQYNCSLARRFRTTPRTIRRWVEFLKSKGLVRITQPYNRRRKLYAEHRQDAVDFYTAGIGKLPKPPAGSGHLSLAEQQRRKDIFEKECGLWGKPCAPFSNMPPLPMIEEALANPRLPDLTCLHSGQGD